MEAGGTGSTTDGLVTTGATTGSRAVVGIVEVTTVVWGIMLDEARAADGMVVLEAIWRPETTPTVLPTLGGPGGAKGLDEAVDKLRFKGAGGAGGGGRLIVDRVSGVDREAENDEGAAGGVGIGGRFIVGNEDNADRGAVLVPSAPEAVTGRAGDGMGAVGVGSPCELGSNFVGS